MNSTFQLPQSAADYHMSSAPPRSASVIEDAIASNANGIEELAIAIGRLESRMGETVLAPPRAQLIGETKGASNLAAVQVENSRMATDLRAMCGRIEAMVRQVNGIYDRLEA